MSFYKDEDKITFDEAEEMVEEFFDEYACKRSYVRTRDICNQLDIESSMHNKHRIHEALKEKCDSSRKSNGTKFKIPEVRS